MAELTHADVVYSPRWFQVWKTLVNWLAFFYQILCAVGYHPLLSSSAKASADGFKPLPAIELLDRASSDCEHSRFGSSLGILHLGILSSNIVEIHGFLTYGRCCGHEFSYFERLEAFDQEESDLHVICDEEGSRKTLKEEEASSLSFIHMLDSIGRFDSIKLSILIASLTLKAYFYWIKEPLIA
ncbi:predicted protein [Arabidopsis lyrata subsp. lyrata]|uniref:Predicted protein n=1 Tax=Arabidopsis lyrata subsp. lyrata TaxID=81972 RepID=D7KQQ9_ARALL|nr:predicted protein [Arabidopsis lyrata subsp. lyrata]